MSGQVARGADGAGPFRQAYRRSALRRILRVKLPHRGVGPADVMVASYPRSGSTWMRFVLTEMLLGDATLARAFRFVPHVGRHAAAEAALASGGRLIRTHEPYVDVYRRAIYMVRDPRDVAISYFNFMQRAQRLELRPGDDPIASFDHFVDAFLAGRLDPYGTWQNHVFSWLQAAGAGRVDMLQLRFEDMRADPAEHLLRIADWLEAPVSAAQANRIAERSTVERMREAEAREIVSSPEIFEPAAVRSRIPLIREGTVGSWRDGMTDDQQRRFVAFSDGLSTMGYEPALPGR